MINFLDDIGEDLLGIDGYSCASSDVFPFFEAAKFIIRIIQIAVPFGLVIWGSLDWFKALIAHDEKEMRMKRKPFIARVIAALVVLILPWIMTAISNVVAGESNTVNFWTCYHEAQPRIDFSKLQERAKDSNGNSIIGGFGDDVHGSGNGGGSNFVPPSGRTDYESCYGLDETKCSTGKTDIYNCFWTRYESGKTERKTCKGLTENQCESSVTATHQCQWTGKQYGCQNGAPHSCQQEEREIYNYSCSQFTTKDSCNAGRTATDYCKWTGDQYKCQPVQKIEQ